MPMRNDQVVTVRRTDYRPPAFLLDRVVLEFDLDPLFGGAQLLDLARLKPQIEHRGADADAICLFRFQ